jgi:hypothetical protein
MAIVIRLVPVPRALQIGLQFLVNVLETAGEAFCMRVDRIFDEGDSAAWVATVVSKEQRDEHRSILHVDVDELGNWEKITPVILLIVAIDPKILFQGLIDVLRLTVALMVVRSRSVAFDIEQVEKLAGELGDELRAVIRDDVDGESVQSPDVATIEASSFFCRDFGGGENKVHHLGEAVDAEVDSVVA